MFKTLNFCGILQASNTLRIFLVCISNLSKVTFSKDLYRYDKVANFFGFISIAKPDQELENNPSVQEFENHHLRQCLSKIPCQDLEF